MKRTDPPSVSNSRNRVYGVKIRFDLLFCCWCQCLVPGAFFLLLLLYFIRVSCLSRSWCCMLIEFHAHWTLDFRTIELCPMNLLIKYRSNFFFYLKISNVFNGHKHDFIEFHEMSFTFCQIDRLTSTTELWLFFGFFVLTRVLEKKIQLFFCISCNSRFSDEIYRNSENYHTKNISISLTFNAQICI